MKITLRNFAVLTTLISLLFAGCGGGEVTVSGKLTNGGSPLEVGDQGVVQLHFVQLEGDEPSGHSFVADVGKDGNFEIEIPEGEYRIAVKQLDPYPNVDKLEGKFGEENSPIKKTIEGSDELNIDISKH